MKYYSRDELTKALAGHKGKLVSSVLRNNGKDCPSLLYVLISQGIFNLEDALHIIDTAHWKGINIYFELVDFTGVVEKLPVRLVYEVV